MAPLSKRRKLGNSSINDTDVDAFDLSAHDDLLPSFEEHDVANGEDRSVQENVHRRTREIHVPDSKGPFMGDVYNSSLFKLQLDELLCKVQPNYERSMAKAEKALRKLKTVIERIPEREALPVLDAEQRQQKSHKVAIPFPEPRPPKGAKYTLAYSRPANINVVGSYARKTAISSGDHLGVDLAVTMPSDIFQEKDYLDYRYFHKRAYYLACIATGVQESKDCNFCLDYAYQNDNHLQPIIIVKSSSDGGDDDFTKEQYRIRVILAIDEEKFPITKTLPDKNCVRKRSSDIPRSKRSNGPTPFYNATLRSESSSLGYLKYLHSASLQSDGYRDACALGSVWLRQRGLGTGLLNGGFGPFEWAATMALLMFGGGPKGRPILSKGYDSYQLFKATLQYLAMYDLARDPLYIQSEGLSLGKEDGPVLFDGARGLNVLFKMTRWSHASLRHEIRNSLRFLNDPHTDQFEACFITKATVPLLRFDRVISLIVSDYSMAVSRNADATPDAMRVCQKVYQVLKKGLGDRVTLIHVEPPPSSTWSTNLSRPLVHQFRRVTIGLLLNPEHVSRTVDRGPSAEDKEAAAEYRKFWGEKAELRRYKDGSIQESLIWSFSVSKGGVMDQIVTHVIRRHLGEEAANSLEFVGTSFERILLGQKIATVEPLTLYQPAISAFDVLQEQIRGLEGLPLQIRQITPADRQLRYASPQAPVLNPNRCGMEPASVCIQFEGSARWPDEIFAIQRTKIAFLLKMGELFRESTPHLTARVGLENTNESLLNIAFLDVRYPSGAFFRLRIHHEREQSLLERALESSTHSSGRREATASALSTYKRTFVHSPFLTQAVRTLSTRFPLLSPSIRLMKRWRDSHLLSGHISDELIEILTIRTFVHPYPWSIPGSVITGFLRTLTFISKWDWRSEPLIVDFNGDMNNQNIDNIKLRFEAWRKIDAAMNRVVMFAASNLDPDGITWTELGPSKVVAARFTSLAKAACASVKEQGLKVQAMTLFAPSLEDYDFVIHLNSQFVEDFRGNGKRQGGFKNLQILELEDKSLIGFNPLHSFLDELKSLHGGNIVFFYNEQGGSVIGGLWNRQTGPRSWKVNMGYSSMPIAHKGDEDTIISINQTATLNDIARLGGDMISKLETKR